MNAKEAIGFDAVMPREAQEQWLASATPIITHGTRIDDEAQRAKHTKRFAKLATDDVFMEDVLPAMQRYIELAFPNRS